MGKKMLSFYEQFAVFLPIAKSSAAKDTHDVDGDWNVTDNGSR